MGMKPSTIKPSFNFLCETVNRPRPTIEINRSDSEGPIDPMGTCKKWPLLFILSYVFISVISLSPPRRWKRFPLPRQSLTEVRAARGHPHHSKRNRDKSPKAAQIWRIFGVEVHPDEILLENTSSLDPAILNSLYKRLKISLSQPLNIPIDNIRLPEPISNVTLVRRSLDARKRKRRNNVKEENEQGPRFVYVLDVTLSENSKIRLKHQPGRQELLESTQQSSKSVFGSREEIQPADSRAAKPTVAVIGAGPAGLFAALELARAGCRVVVLERGQPVERRGRDIGALVHRRALNQESNFCFGEGGAGTWSDGKLTTRIGRNAQTVRYVLETLVQFGAPSSILVDGAPHLGTDRLVKLLRNLRQYFEEELGGEIRFGCRMREIIVEEGKIEGVRYEEKFKDGNGKGTMQSLASDSVILATGHSARDVYEHLHDVGVELAPKGFAVGFRVEHPQALINQIQYGVEWGQSVVTRKSLTDKANQQWFHNARAHAESDTDSQVHLGRLPVPSYRLATDKAFDGNKNRGAYSFCMCPGGQIVPASTSPNEVCVNGMSFSKRDSLWANSALVVTVDPDDQILEPYREHHGVLAGVAFQRDVERKASTMGGGNFCVPVQRLTDFVERRSSISVPTSSYRLGVKASACHELYPEPLISSLIDALVNHFESVMPGFVCSDGLLHGVETRTSSPVRIERDRDTMETAIKGFYPAGEGAGFAGGIVSAAVDGLSVALAVLKSLNMTSSISTPISSKKQSSVSAFY